MNGGGWLRRGVAATMDYAAAEPGQALAVIAVLHLLVWTALPILVCPNLQLDLVEDLALGKEWQLGYWKHPPLPWWIADLVYRATGSLHSVYVLGPLAVALCWWGLYLLGREILGPLYALMAVLALSGVHFYNFSAVKFAHDQMQLPFWAFTGLFFYRAILGGRWFDWAMAGALLAGAFWSKYAAVPFAATLALVLLFDPLARRTWRTGGPWIMAAMFAAVIAPNLWWLATHEFLPLQYVGDRARLAVSWDQFILYPLLWVASQMFFLLPAIGLIAVLYVGTRASEQSGDPAARAAFGRRYITFLALGPFALTLAPAMFVGRFPIAMWGYPLWSFAPIAALAWLGPIPEQRRLQWFAAGCLAIFVAFPAAYAAAEMFEPLVRDREKATQFPGAAVAAAITKAWHDEFATPLAYVCGSEFVANTVAVYSPDRPHVMVHCSPKLSPWIDEAELRRRGIAVVDSAGLARWGRMFGAIEPKPTLELPRRTLVPVRPARVLYGFVAPQH